MPTTTKIGRMVIYNEDNSSTVSHDPLTTWSHFATWQTKNKISPLPQGLWLPHLADGNSWWRKLPHNLRWLSNHLITWGHVINWKLDISSSARSITTKHGRLVTYGKRSAPSLQNFFRARVIVFCLWENARIVFGYWLPKNYANFSWIGGNFCVFRSSHLAISLSKSLFSVAKKVANIPLFLVFQITIHHF